MNTYLLIFKAQKNKNINLSNQVYIHILNGILKNKIKLGEKLPPSRQLASIFCVSRNTILNAIDILNSENLLKTYIGSGTYITDTLPDIYKQNFSFKNITNTEILMRTRQHNGLLATGITDKSLFPSQKFIRAMKNGITDSININNKTGHIKFKQSIVNYINTIRGIECTTNNIVPITSAQAGFNLIFNTILDKNSNILLEDPCYQDIRTLIKLNNHNEKFISNIYNFKNINAVYLTPSNQYDTDDIMRMSQRLEIINKTLKYKSWILEDDIGCEICFEKVFPPSFYSISENVIYIGSFSKVISPSIKIAYIIAPEKITKKLNSYNGIMGTEPSAFIQSTISQMIDDKSLYVHIRHMKKIYKERIIQIKKSISKHMPFASFNKDKNNGLEISVNLPSYMNDKKITQEIYKTGFSCKRLSKNSIHKNINGLSIGFGNTNVKEIDNLIEKVSKVCLKYNIH